MVESLLLAFVAAEGGVRLLAPRERRNRAGADRHSRSFQRRRDRARSQVRAASGRTRDGPRRRRDRRAHAGRPAFVRPGWPTVPPARRGRCGDRRRAGGGPFPSAAAVQRARPQAWNGRGVGHPVMAWVGHRPVKGAAIEALMAGGAGAAAVAVTRAVRAGGGCRPPWFRAVRRAAGDAGAGGAGPAVQRLHAPARGGDSIGCARRWRARAGVSVGEVYSVDASRRTTAANAYVTGLGSDQAGRPVRHAARPLQPRRDQGRRRARARPRPQPGRDPRRRVRGAGGARRGARGAAAQLGDVAERGAPAALPALALAAGVVGAPIGLLSSRLSRAVERRADAFSLR